MTVTSETPHPYGRRILSSILAGGLSLLIVAVALIEVLVPYVRPAPLVALPVALVGGVVVGATVVGTVDPTGIGLVVYATILGGYFLHGFVHLTQSFLLRGYAPGLVTAIVLVIPVSLYLYWRLLAADLIDIRIAAAICVAGLVLFAPLVIGASRLSVRVDRWLD